MTFPSGFPSVFVVFNGLYFIFVLQKKQQQEEIFLLSFEAY